VHWKGCRTQKPDGALVEVDLIHENRTWGSKKREESRKAHEREFGDMEKEFGELHFILLALYSTFVKLLDELIEFEKSKAH
jgi:hypothetical protein